GIGYGYGFEEIGRAQMLGINLPAEDAAAARRASEEMIDRVALQGDALKGFTGLFNATGVTPVAAVHGDWGSYNAAGSATPDQIVADMNNAILNVFFGTNTTAIADTLLLPWSKFQVVATRRMSTDTDASILDFFRRNNAYTATSGQPLTLRGLRGLDTAGVSGVPRMIAYRRSPEV